MTEASIRERLARPIGAVWPNDEQNLVLQAIFAADQAALAAFQLWRDGLDLAGDFDRAVFRLLPLLYRRLLSLNVDDPVMGRLKGVYRSAWSDTHALFHGTAPAVAALAQNGIPAMLLKGAPLVLRYYRNHGSRPMSDLDIAVHFRQAREAIACLAQAGWLPDAPISDDDLRYRHAATLRGPHRRELDLHWHMLFERCDEAADALFWDHAEALDFNGVLTRTPAPELHFLHGVAHGLRSNIEPPVRWIADALTILQTDGPDFDWALLSRAASQLSLAGRLALGLRYLRVQYAAAIPEHVLRDLGNVRPSLAERLEIRMMLRTAPQTAPKFLRKSALLAAEFLRLAETSGRWNFAAFPAFLRYRLGARSWRNLAGNTARFGLARLRQLKRPA